MRIFLIIIVLFFCSCQSSKVFHKPYPSPKAWLKYCDTYDKPYTEENKKTLDDIMKIYLDIFLRFFYTKDKKDVWNKLSGEFLYGDCEDFAITLREELLNNGFRKNDIRLALCAIKKTTIEYDHMVCLIYCDGKEYVADNVSLYLKNEYIVYKWAAVLDEQGIYWNKM